MSDANMKLAIVHVDMDHPDNQNVTPSLEEGEFIEKHVVSVSSLLESLVDFQKKGMVVDARLMHFAMGMQYGRHH